jgi:hypothetical protein
MAGAAPIQATVPANAARDNFARQVAKGTGLSLAVIHAWMYAEGAYAQGGTGHFNYLNVRPSSNAGVSEGRSPGGFATFRNANDAAKATINVLHQPNMRTILNARSKNDKAQLAAIAASPWDANHYRGGAALTGAYKTTVGSAPLTTGAASVIGGSGVPNPFDWVSGLTGWAEGAALRALAYIVLTVAAIALFVLGLERTLGPSPLTRGLPTGINPVTARIPY